MFRFCNLFSGSSGNSSFVESDTTKILIDCGESAKKITETLNEIQVNIKEIDAILITHEHIDHIKSIGTLSNKYNIPIYANEETINAIPFEKFKLSKENIHIFDFSEDFNIGNLQIHPFSIPHDAANPCGFNILYNNKKISIATDIGHITKEILSNLEKSSFLLLESNYDPNILKCSSYPYHLKERISGPFGHLSNSMAGKTISYLANSGLKNVMLGHLSKENNFPELAYKTVVEELLNNNISDSSIKISVATRFKHSSIIEI
ncbi:MAG: MBL fold metallo-hydrolase [Clostridiales bacterium]|nr:MBL fold metallo-hydrolase [Clostridiales bacterium]